MGATKNRAQTNARATTTMDGIRRPSSGVSLARPLAGFANFRSIIVRPSLRNFELANCGTEAANSFSVGRDESNSADCRLASWLAGWLAGWRLPARPLARRKPVSLVCFRLPGRASCCCVAPNWLAQCGLVTSSDLGRASSTKLATLRPGGRAHRQQQQYKGPPNSIQMQWLT